MRVLAVPRPSRRCFGPMRCTRSPAVCRHRENRDAAARRPRDEWQPLGTAPDLSGRAPDLRAPRHTLDSIAMPTKARPPPPAAGPIVSSWRKIISRGGECRLKPDGALERLERFGWPARTEQSHANIILRFGRVRSAARDFGKLFGGLGRPAERGQRHAQVGAHHPTFRLMRSASLHRTNGVLNCSTRCVDMMPHDTTTATATAHVVHINQRLSFVAAATGIGMCEGWGRVRLMWYPDRATSPAAGTNSQAPWPRLLLALCLGAVVVRRNCQFAARRTRAASAAAVTRLLPFAEQARDDMG